MTEPTKVLEFNLLLGVESEDYGDEADAFLDWLRDELEHTPFRVAVDGPTAFLDYDEEYPLQKEGPTRSQVRSNWEQEE